MKCSIEGSYLEIIEDMLNLLACLQNDNTTN